MGHCEFGGGRGEENLNTEAKQVMKMIQAAKWEQCLPCTNKYYSEVAADETRGSKGGIFFFFHYLERSQRSGF